MTPNVRLRLIVATLALSTIYGVIVAQDQDLAQAIAVGYVAVLLTVFVLVNFWKKPRA
jgi:1,4-dihydroxy-2-naphthoate octaprenyltransferase